MQESRDFCEKCFACVPNFVPGYTINEEEVDWIECSRCKKLQCVQCSEVQPNVYREYRLLEPDEQRTKDNLEYYMDSSLLTYSHSPQDSDEFYKSNTTNCQECGEICLGTSLIYEKQCFRCLNLFLPYPHSQEGKQCRTHPGKHELPLDKDSKVCYEKGTIFNPFSLHTGRWTCCGALCHHDHPQCPFHPGYGEKAVHNRFKPERKIPLEQLGCQFAFHMFALLPSNSELLSFRRFQLKDLAQTATNLLNFSTPVKYPSAHGYEPGFERVKGNHQIVKPNYICTDPDCWDCPFRRRK